MEFMSNINKTVFKIIVVSFTLFQFLPLSSGINHFLPVSSRCPGRNRFLPEETQPCNAHLLYIVMHYNGSIILHYNCNHLNKL